MNNSKLKILMSGGGTGGHIFPAVAIANEIKSRFPNAEFLFVGANGKMEMEKVPQAGFRIEGLNITGFDRGNLLKNIGLPFKIISSLWKARKIIKNFKPDFAVGTGGFASGPALYVASSLGVPIFVQEQNSILGKTNQFLGRRAKAVFMGYPNISSFLPAVFTGNPIRENIVTEIINTKEAKEKMGLDPNKLTILSVGGSLGSKTLNNAWRELLPKLKEKNIQLVLFPSMALISSMLSSAAFLPTSGSAPAPKPSVSLTPSWILLATGFSAKACASVLQTTKSTPFIPFSYMCFRALFPPPPTPITFMIEDVPFGKRISKPDSLFKISIVFSISLLKN